jgi:hypothetical protein
MSCSKDNSIPKGTWQKQGSVILPDSTDNYNVAEPTIIYDTGAHILHASMVYKMWFRNGNNCIRYAESVNGIRWEKYNKTILNHFYCPYVFKCDDKYLMYCVDSTWHHLNCFSSHDGIVWQSIDQNSIHDVYQAFGNTAIAFEGGTYYLFYEAMRNNVWSIYEATSGDCINWSSDNNNIISWQGSYGGPVYKKIGNAYYLWVHGSTTGTLPTQLYRFKSIDLIHWSKDVQSSTLTRTTFDEGVDCQVGQVADPYILEANGKTFMYYSGGRDGTGDLKNTLNFTIKLAIADMSLTELVRTREGVR